VAATENPVETYMGPEVVRISGMNLKRFKSNPVFLNSHKHDDINAVLGSVKAWKEDRQLIAAVTYADTEQGNLALDLVNQGHLKAVSIGFTPDATKSRILEEGQRDGDFEGPGVVHRKSELIELSQVPIGADHSALKRSYEMLEHEIRSADTRVTVDPETLETSPEVSEHAKPPFPPKDDEGEDDEEKPKDKKGCDDTKKKKKKKAKKPEDDEDEDADEKPFPPKAKKTYIPIAELADGERAERRKIIEAFTPECLKPEIDRLFEANPSITTDEAYETIRKMYIKRLEPVGQSVPRDQAVKPQLPEPSGLKSTILKPL
jgi:hypothetical protein